MGVDRDAHLNRDPALRLLRRSEYTIDIVGLRDNDDYAGSHPSDDPPLVSLTWLALIPERSPDLLPDIQQIWQQECQFWPFVQGGYDYAQVHCEVSDSGSFDKACTSSVTRLKLRRC